MIIMNSEPVLIYSPLHINHKVSLDCPDQPERLDEALEELIDIVTVQDAPNGEEYLPLFHTPDYIHKVRTICNELGRGEINTIIDNCFSQSTYQAACYAVGATIEAAKYAQHARRAFAFVRPPGHHAWSDKEGGFCVFNNVAIATEFLRQQGERKILIIDVDLHLGDGTIEYVTKTPNTSYFSINCAGLWPHGDQDQFERCENIFLPSGTSDARYIQVLERRLTKTIERENPSIIAVSAGFDTCVHDSNTFEETFGGSFNLTSDSYQALWKILDRSLIPYFAVLEGGYDPLSIMDGVESFFNRE